MLTEKEKLEMSLEQCQIYYKFWDSQRHLPRAAESANHFANQILDIKRRLKTAISKMSSSNILIVTYKDIKDRAVNICENICKELKLEKKFEGYHFQGPRGSNAYKECDGVIILGLPYSNINSAWQDAYILFPNKDDDFKDSWVHVNMLWELVQNIHRRRWGDDGAGIFTLDHLADIFEHHITAGALRQAVGRLLANHCPFAVRHTVEFRAGQFDGLHWHAVIKAQTAVGDCLVTARLAPLIGNGFGRRQRRLGVDCIQAIVQKHDDPIPIPPAAL